MTIVARFEESQPGAGDRAPATTDTPLPGLIGWLTTTDHKRIGLAYLATAFGFFVVGGLMAALMRAELAEPGLQVVNTDQYNQLFTIHGTVMMFLFAVPMGSGFANYLIPLHIGAPDMAFPRVNALSYWLFLGGGLVVLSGFVTSEGAADFGWTAYVPLSDNSYSPGAGGNLWITGLALTGIATTLTSVNVLATVIGLRAPGMTMFRLPLFTWNMVAVSFMVLLAFPVITGALVMLLADRMLESHFFTPTAGGDPVLYQHLFWFFGHPEVYIVALPFFGIISEIIPVFSRKPLFGYKAVVIATVLIGAYSLTVWAHHMFTTGAIADSFFSGATLLIAVPTGIKIFSWVFTMWGGRVRFPTPMLYAVGFLVVFLLGGLTGPMLAVRAFDSHVHDTYFVVAHMHYVLLGTSVFAMFAALFFWWPKFFGHRLREGLGHVQFWLLFVGFNLTFFPQHILGLRGMPRRYADYPENIGYESLNLLSSLSVILIGLSVILFLANIWWSARHPVPAGPDPWEGNTLEWATSSPPPPHNFDAMPRIRSERPVFDQRLTEAVRSAPGGTQGQGATSTGPGPAETKGVDGRHAEDHHPEDHHPDDHGDDRGDDNRGREAR